MSGIEAVLGLVLGGFPLLISGLEHWNDAAKPIHRFKHFERDYSRAVEDALLSDANEPRWQDGDIVTALQARLGEAYDRYTEVLRSMQESILTVLNYLDCDKPEVQAKLAAESMNATSSQHIILTNSNESLLKASARLELQKLKFAFSGQKLKDLIEDVRRHNKKLRTLSKLSERIATAGEAATALIPRARVDGLLSFSKHADCVYGLVTKAWKCPCHSDHFALLWLQHRLHVGFEFKLLVFSAHQGLGGKADPGWTQQGLQIDLLPERMESMPQRKGPMSNPGPPGQGTLIHRSVLRKPRGRPAVKGTVVTMGTFPAVISSQVLIHQPVPMHVAKRVAIAAPAPSVSLAEISNLCERLATTGMSTNCCIGSLTDQIGGARYKVTAQPDQKLSATEVSLLQVLQTSHQPRLSRAQRLSVALAIASNHLKLHSTPWARRQWQSADIYFPRSKTDPLEVMFDKPYVPASFDSLAAAPAQEIANRAQRGFAGLGIMLLELLFGRSLDDHELWLQNGFGENQKTPFFRLAVAKSWTESVEGEAGVDYAAAVNWCLTESPMTLQGEASKRDLATKVVLPLEKACEWIHL